MVEAQEQLLHASREQGEALRRADLAALARADQRSASARDTLAALEARGRNALKLAGLPTGTLRDLCARLPEPARANALARADRVRALAETTLREQRRVGEAGRVLARHMQGLSQQVGRRLNHAGVYGRHGGVGPGPVIASGLDMTL